LGAKVRKNITERRGYIQQSVEKLNIRVQSIYKAGTGDKSDLPEVAVL